MNANIPSSGLIGTWVQVSGNSSWTVDNIHAPNAVFSNLATGNYIFKWVVAQGDCDSAESQISFKISLPPTTAQVTAASIAVCNSTSTTLNGNSIALGTGTWQVVSGPNTPTFANIHSGTTSVSGLTTGTYILRWSSTNGASCPSSIADVKLNVNATATAGPDQNLCN